jgi:hypothetical protein
MSLNLNATQAKVLASVEANDKKRPAQAPVKAHTGDGKNKSICIVRAKDFDPSKLTVGKEYQTKGKLTTCQIKYGDKGQTLGLQIGNNTDMIRMKEPLSRFEKDVGGPKGSFVPLDMKNKNWTLGRTFKNKVQSRCSGTLSLYGEDEPGTQQYYAARALRAIDERIKSLLFTEEVSPTATSWGKSHGVNKVYKGVYNPSGTTIKDGKEVTYAAKASVVSRWHGKERKENGQLVDMNKDVHRKLDSCESLVLVTDTVVVDADTGEEIKDEAALEMLTQKNVPVQGRWVLLFSGITFADAKNNVNAAPDIGWCRVRTADFKRIEDYVEDSDEEKDAPQTEPDDDGSFGEVNGLKVPRDEDHDESPSKRARTE